MLQSTAKSPQKTGVYRDTTVQMRWLSDFRVRGVGCDVGLAKLSLRCCVKGFSRSDRMNNDSVRRHGSLRQKLKLRVGTSPIQVWLNGFEYYETAECSNDILTAMYHQRVEGRSVQFFIVLSRQN